MFINLTKYFLSKIFFKSFFINFFVIFQECVSSFVIKVSTGSDSYSEATTNLVVDTAGVNATTTINYSTRTVTWGENIVINKLGRNTTSRTF